MYGWNTYIYKENDLKKKSKQRYKKSNAYIRKSICAIDFC